MPIDSDHPSRGGSGRGTRYTKVIKYLTKNASNVSGHC
jgi:hypothetical protein